MSKQPQLPPRCPISKTKSLDSSSSIVWNDESFHLQCHKSLSQSFGLEEQPAWLDDLLGDWDLGFELKTHRRSASDSGTVLDDVESPSVNTEKEDTNAATVLESACVYGPNSPRAKDKSLVQESAIVSALSEYASHGPAQYVNSDIFVSGLPQVDSVQDVAGEANMELKPFKRHSAQRSRVRKLQYIAELEKTVENFQNIVSELTVRVEAIVEHHVYLSMENKQLKQKLSRLQQEKFIMEREYQCMRNEVDGLRKRVLFSRNGSNARLHLRSNSNGDTEKLHVEPSWHMIDMGRLHIN